MIGDVFEAANITGMAIEGLSTAYTYIGSRWSMAAWHSEDLALPSINVHHEGNIKAIKNKIFQKICDQTKLINKKNKNFKMFYKIQK